MKKRWTKEEEDYLEESWGEKSIPTLAKNLNRTVGAVTVKKNRMGLGAHLMGDERISANSLVKTVFSTSNSRGHSDLKIWARNGLKIYKHRINQGSFKMVDIDEFWTWAEKHKNLLDLSNMVENSLGLEPDWVREKRKIDIKEKFNTSPWTKVEDQRLKQLLSEYKHTYADISSALRRSEGAVRRRIADLNIVQRPIRNDNKMWTDEEIKILLEMVDEGHSFEEIGKRLGRTGHSAKGKHERILKPEAMKRVNRRARTCVSTK